jgi:hypothetical protein
MSDDLDGWRDIEFVDMPSREELVEGSERRGRCAMHGDVTAN